MKHIFLLSVIFISVNTQAQMLTYTDDGIDTRKLEKTYSIESPGQKFIHRMDALYKQSDSGHITQERYNSFLKQFEDLANKAQGEANIPGKMKTLSVILDQLNDVAYNIDGNRDQIYHIAAPVYKAVGENWGDEVIHMAIANAYFLLREHVLYMSANDEKLKTAIHVLNKYPITFGNQAQQCSYTVSLSPQVTKDKIDIFFCDMGLYYKASKKYFADRLLIGPIAGWDFNVDESLSISNILRMYSEMPGNMSLHIPVKDPAAGKTTRIKQDLSSEMKWFVWVFKNDKLYYSYMVEPCSDMSRCEVN